ncbi:MAG TPA: hypothetical protein VGC74_07130 [Stenotrophomonas sp.]|jgi:hypothetical protein
MRDYPTNTEYLYDRPVDQWWRRFGFWLYLVVGVLPMALVPSGSGAPAWTLRALDWLPALRGLLAASSGDGRIVAWVFGGLLAYPLMHRAMRSRVYREPRAPYWQGLLAVLVIDVVLFGALWFDLVSMRGNRLASLVRECLLSDGPLMVVMAAIISSMYAFVLFLNIQVLLVAFSNPNKEK